MTRSLAPASALVITDRRVTVTSGPGKGAATKARFRGRAIGAMIVILALIGAGGYVLVRQRQAAQSREWPAQVQPLATFVETTLGHPFKNAVPLVTLPRAEYEVKLGIYELARVPHDASGGFSGLRALGLIDADPRAAAVGEYAALERSVFYDPATTTIYQVDAAGSPFHDAKVIAALSGALLDQYKHWGAAMGALSPSQQIGYEALLEGTGTYAIRVRNNADPTLAEAFLKEQTDRRAQRDALKSTISPWILGLLDMGDASSWGITTRATSEDFFMALNAPASDAAVLDAARGLETPPGVSTSDPSTMGMYLWYGVLAPVLGSDAAFHLATAWSGDSVTYRQSGTQDCIRASIAARDAASLAALVGGLNTWAATRPASASATVDGKGTVAVVEACGPTEGAALAPPVAPSPAQYLQDRMVREQVLLQQMAKLTMPLTAASVSCAVNSYRTDGVVGFDDELPSLVGDANAVASAALVSNLQELATFCSAAR
ncbi:MAG: hypothetical protein F2789_06325 [Actinobacteria bacterium]|nr:hypothetical protein [Actinomycetota bacterium]